MCNAFSCILTRKGDILRHKNPNVHSHECMIKQHKLKENRNPERTDWLRIECTPLDNKCSSPITQWVVRVDETTVPLWYTEDKNSYDTIVRKAAEQWKKKHCIRGCYRVVEVYDNGKVREECWCRNDKRHRPDGPAWILYNQSGSVREECWFRNDKKHRLDGPAYTYYNESGSVREERWYRNDLLYRTDGPAWIFYNESGKVRVEYWYRNGQEINPLTTK